MNKNKDAALILWAMSEGWYPIVYKDLNGKRFNGLHSPYDHNSYFNDGTIMSTLPKMEWKGDKRRLPKGKWAKK